MEHRSNIPQTDDTWRVVSSEGSMRDELQKSLLWRDIETWCKSRIETHQRAVLENKDASLEQIRFSQGIIANCRDILDMPDFILTQLQELTTTEDHGPDRSERYGTAD